MLADFFCFECRCVPFSGTGFLVPPQVFSTAEAPEEAPGPLDVAASEGAGGVDEMEAESGGVSGVEEEEKEEGSVHTSARAGVDDGDKSRNGGRNALGGGDRVSRVGFRRFDRSKTMLRIFMVLPVCDEGISLHRLG